MSESMDSVLDQLKSELQSLADPEKAGILSRFFKTGKGEYGEGDVFLGIKVPLQRVVARKYCNLPLRDAKKLLSSRVHEHRLTALFILVIQYQKADNSGRSRIADFYLSQTSGINNWDLVDLSAPKIVGAYLFDKDKSILYRLAESSHLWDRRISVLATFYFISKGEFDDALKIAGMLLKDKHDLIHKAVGWMLREIGKRDIDTEEKFLDNHCKEMPRTMLRYAIEKFDEKKRKHYMCNDY